MMSIRTRLILICLTVALLPAIPLSLLVGDLIGKSFNVGLSGAVSDALEGGMAISRLHLETLRGEFEREIRAYALLEYPDLAQSMPIVAPEELPGPSAVSGAIRFAGSGDETDIAALPGIGRLIGGRRLVARTVDDRDSISFADAAASRPAGEARLQRTTAAEPKFYETEDRAYMLAAWTVDDRGGTVVAWRRVDPAFLEDAGKLLDAGKGFAGLRFAENRLTKSFLYSFLIIYAVVALITFLAALVLAERIARPARSLSEAASRVAGGDWSVRITERAGGEMGKLVEGFNAMVSRLDAQRRRLVDVEKMASWRDFARHLAHEIKNPLLPIRLTIQELKDRYRGGDDDYGRFLDESSKVVEEELGSLQRLVREFSSFARMPGLSPVEDSLVDLVDDVAGLYNTVETHIETGHGIARFPFDRDQMRRVLVNLFDNAIAVANEGCGPSVRICIEREGGDLVIRFNDDGPGIPEDDLERVFEPYFTTRREGSGLGLAMVKNIILMHGGTIAASNDGGATFTIRLPLSGPPGPERGKE